MTNANMCHDSRRNVFFHQKMEKSHRVDAIPPRKSLQRDWTHLGRTLRPEPMQDHKHRLDEIAGDPPHANPPLTVDPAELYSTRQATRIFRPAAT
jgi:hypothetical protein